MESMDQHCSGVKISLTPVSAADAVGSAIGTVGLITQGFHLWLAQCRNWQPTHWSQTPSDAIAIELLDPAIFTAEEALAFLKGFNSDLLQDEQSRWAVATLVQVRYDGVLRPGDTIRGHAFENIRIVNDAVS